MRDIVIELADGRGERYHEAEYHANVPDSGCLMVFKRGAVDARGRAEESTIEVVYAAHAWVQLTVVDE